MNGRTPYKAFVDGLPNTKREEVKEVKKSGLTGHPARWRHCQVNTVTVQK